MLWLTSPLKMCIRDSITGTGNVGAKLLGQLQQQLDFLLEQMNLQVKVVGLSNSRKMLIDEEGISLDSWKEKLNTSEAADLQKYVDEIISRNLRNSIFVDMTANDKVATVYDQLLEKSIAVVACNKVAASSAYKNYCLLYTSRCV